MVDTSGLTKLGEHKNKAHGKEGLEWFANPIGCNLVEFVTGEFTCNCPKTGQPDFATIRVRYVPREKCIESKSLKLYLWHFRNGGHFHEAVTKQIMDDLVHVLEPAWLQVLGEFNVRGGISEKVLASSLPEGTDEISDFVELSNMEYHLYEKHGFVLC